MPFFVLDGQPLSLATIADISHARVQIQIAPHLRSRVDAASAYIQDCVANNDVIYGVTTNFGGMARGTVDADVTAFLQETLLWGLKCGVGSPLAVPTVRAAMVIAAQALLKGVSGIRFEFIERLVSFLNHQFTPKVYEHGSIGASGDLVPMSYIAGCITGLGPEYKVITKEGLEISALDALGQLHLAPLKLGPKEGLALVNSTAMMTGIASHCVQSFASMLDLSCVLNAFFILALQGKGDSLSPFVHAQKPHPGQIKIAEKMRGLIAGAKPVSSETIDSNQLVQDRYSVRCLAQYLGVIWDGLTQITEQVTTEANSVTDNPLIDVEHRQIFHSGNFLGEYIGVGMDQLRYYIGLLVKHLDTQIALLVTPEFSHGLTGSLVGDPMSSVKFGLKGLQICANSLMPLILHQATPIAPLYPTHAEQFNQNINSQGFSSAVLASKSLDLANWYCAIAVIFAIQSIEIRCFVQHGHYDASHFLPEALMPFYTKVYQLIGKTNTRDNPLIGPNHSETLDTYVKHIYDDLNLSRSDLCATFR